MAIDSAYLGLKGIWRVSWIGAAQSAGTGAHHTQKSFPTYFQELRVDQNGALKHGVTVVRKDVQGGDAVRFYIGRILVDGVHKPELEAVFGPWKRETVRLRVAAEHIKFESLRAALADADLTVRPNLQRFVAAAEQVDPNWDLGLRAELTDEKSGGKYLIPAWELFRFFYAHTSFLANAFVHDSLGLGDESVINLDKSEAMPDGLARIQVAQNVDNDSAIHLAEIALDDEALRRAKQIFAYASASEHGIIRALPPFDEDLTLTVVMRYPKAGDDPRAVIHRIISCDRPPRFRVVQIVREYAASPHQAKKSEEPKEEPQVQTIFRAMAKPGLASDIKASLGSTTNGFQVADEEQAERFPKYIDYPVRHIKREKPLAQVGADSEAGAQAVQKQIVSPEPESLPVDVSTIRAGGSSETPKLDQAKKIKRKYTTQVQVDRSGVEPGFPARTKQLLQTIVDNATYPLAVRTYSLGYEVLGEGVEALAGCVAVLMPNKIGDAFEGWCFSDTHLGIPRKLVVAEISQDAKVTYLLDFEPRGTDEVKRQRAAISLRSLTFTRLSEDQVRKVVERIVCEKTFSPSLDPSLGLHIEPIRHAWAQPGKLVEHLFSEASPGS
jgi:hypothetical protein